MGLFSLFSPFPQSNKSASSSPKPMSKPAPLKPMGIFNLDKTNPDRKTSLNSWQWKRAFKKDKGKIPGTSRGFKTVGQRMAVAKEFSELQKKYHLGNDGVVTPQKMEGVLKKMDKERQILLQRHAPSKEVQTLSDKIKYGQALIKGEIKK